MVERRIVVDTLRLNYQGLLNVNEFYRVMDKWFREKGFDKYEKRNFEQVFKTGRQIEIEIEPWKKMNDYAKAVMKVVFLFTNVKDVVIEKDGHKVNMQQGKVAVTFMGYLETDWENKWEGTPWTFILRAVFDQYVYKINTDKFYSLVAEDTMHLYNTLKAYLNLQRYY
jgi:hypothetical protein